MKKRKLLIIGDTSLEDALGSKLLREEHTLCNKYGWKISVSYHSPATNYSPSMSRKRGKVFYRLADKRSWEWWGYQRMLKEYIEKLKPDLVLVTGVLPLDTAIFLTLKRQGAMIVNYLTDDPWNPIHKRRRFLTNIARYDHIFSTKKALQIKLRNAGAISTSWLAFAYDPVLHYPVEADTSTDVLFIGTGARERLPWLRSVAKLKNIKCRLHGNSWDGLDTPGWERKPAVTGIEYCKAIKGAKIVLGLLRKANGDESTDRSYEIGAIGGCGLYQDTIEHRQLLPGYPDVAFFKDPKELAHSVKCVIEDADLQQKLRRIGEQEIRKPENTYSARLETIMKWAEQ